MPTMKHFLVVYDRPAGRTLEFTEYPRSADALEARFAAERQHRGNRDIEVVVLHANSEEILRQTHARYFYSLREIVEQGMVELEEIRAGLGRAGSGRPTPR